VVERGSEYDTLCQEIIDALVTFNDADTGAPVVRDVGRSERIYPDGARVLELPDLIVRWATSPAAEHRAVTSPRFGTITMPTPGRNQTGRSGNHRPQGFLIAVGPEFEQGSALEGASILDLAPTVYKVFRLSAPDAMRGRDLGSRGSPVS
jgi:predicted AlkP superfamily phosphohydrolase/phosphomutase